MKGDLFFAAEIDPAISVIDLHNSVSISEAIEQLEKELFLFYKKEVPYVQIIHGIGSGKLAQAVHEILKKHPLVREWKESSHGGSCIILF